MSSGERFAVSSRAVKALILNPLPRVEPLDELGKEMFIKTSKIVKY